MIDIAGLHRPSVLKALYDRSRPLGLGHLHATPRDMTLEEATMLVLQNEGGYFDYVRGRVLKVRIAGDQLDPRLYDRDNGEGAAARVIDSIR
jgi:hypothetical protein